MPTRDAILLTSIEHVCDIFTRPIYNYNLNRTVWIYQIKTIQIGHNSSITAPSIIQPTTGNKQKSIQYGGCNVSTKLKRASFISLFLKHGPVVNQGSIYILTWTRIINEIYSSKGRNAECHLRLSLTRRQTATQRMKARWCATLKMMNCLKNFTN